MRQDRPANPGPEFMTATGPSHLTTLNRGAGPVSPAVLREQVKQQGLGRYDEVIGLGGKEYRAAVEAAFEGTSVRPRFPFAGLPIGKAMAATKLAVPQWPQPLMTASPQIV